MIRPEDARKLNELDMRGVAVEEARIDAELSRWDDGKRVLVDVGSLSSKLREHLAVMYRGAGWNVELTYGDQREPGVWLAFTAKYGV